MNEDVENLVLEYSMKEEMSGMRAEMPIIRRHMAGLLGGQTLHDMEIAGVKVRLDRLGKRGDLVE